MAVPDTRSPELNYLTRDNIVVPNTDPRTAAQVRDLGALHDSRESNDGPLVRSGEDGGLSVLPVGATLTVTSVAATNVLTAAAHGLTVGDAIRFTMITGGTGSAVDTTYWVITTPDVNTFTISATPGGTVLDITADHTAPTRAQRIDTPSNVVLYTYGSPVKGGA